MFRSLSVAVCCVVMATDIALAAPTADEIMQRVEDRSQGEDMTASHTLVMIPKNGTKRVRSYMLLRKAYDKVVKLVTFFSAPSDVRNAAFMVWDYKGGDDQRWVYLPAVGKVRRLVAGDARQSFFGSDFVFEDFTNRDPDQDTHKLVGAQKVDAWDCWVVESTPKSEPSFAKYRSWVWKPANLVVRQEYYDQAGKVIRRINAVSVAEVQGIQTYRQVTVQDLRTGSESRLEIDNVVYKTGIPDERFEEAQLNRGAPKK